MTKKGDAGLAAPSATPPNFRTAYGPRFRVTKDCGSETLVKQSFKGECDINNIMARFTQTGVIAHVARHSPEYGFATSQDLREALETIQIAQNMFDELPAQLRSRFGYDPGAFLEFVQNPDNKAEMAELGLLNEEAASRYKKPEKGEKSLNASSDVTDEKEGN